RWAGSLMSFPFQDPVSLEKQPRLTRWPLVGLSAGAVALSFGAPMVYSSLIESALTAWGTLPYVMRFGTMSSPVGAFTVYPIFFVAGGGLLLALLTLKRSRGSARFVPPYLSGVQTGTIDIFTGPMNQPVSAVMGHYTLSTLVDEPRLTRWCNWAALMLLVLMVGGSVP
ncbi:MAG: NADH-quinone oxidoreductase subunit L, partial [Desulfohalobiaceae bacterium]